MHPSHILTSLLALGAQAAMNHREPKDVQVDAAGVKANAGVAARQDPAQPTIERLIEDCPSLKQGDSACEAISHIVQASGRSAEDQAAIQHAALDCLSENRDENACETLADIVNKEQATAAGQ